MLGLKLPTDPRWVNLATKSLTDILSDHAWCEQKAASTCISIIQTYSELPELVITLMPIVTEEWGHFRQVIALLGKNQIPLAPQRKDEYVNQLKNFEKKGGSKMDRLLDKLMCCALIEARSCERFRLLSLHFEDAELKKFYHSFMVSEAGHYKLFLDLANLYFQGEVVKNRWDEFLNFEAKILNKLEINGQIMH